MRYLHAPTEHANSSVGHGAADVHAWLQGPTEPAMKQFTRINLPNSMDGYFKSRTWRIDHSLPDAEHLTRHISDLPQLITYISMVVQLYLIFINPYMYV